MHVRSARTRSEAWKAGGGNAQIDLCRADHFLTRSFSLRNPLDRLKVRRPPSPRFCRAQRSHERRFKRDARSFRAPLPTQKTDQLAFGPRFVQLLRSGRIGQFQVERSREVTLQHRRMDVAFTTDRRRVSKLFRYLLDDLHAARLGGRCVFQFVERHDRQCSSGPCPKIFRGDFVSRNFRQILIHIARIDAMTVALVADVLEQLRTRQITASFQYLRVCDR